MMAERSAEMFARLPDQEWLATPRRRVTLFEERGGWRYVGLSGVCTAVTASGNTC